MSGRRIYSIDGCWTVEGGYRWPNDFYKDWRCGSQLWVSGGRVLSEVLWRICRTSGMMLRVVGRESFAGTELLMDDGMWINENNSEILGEGLMSGLTILNGSVVDAVGILLLKSNAWSGSKLHLCEWLRDGWTSRKPLLKYCASSEWTVRWGLQHWPGGGGLRGGDSTLTVRLICGIDVCVYNSAWLLDGFWGWGFHCDNDVEIGGGFIHLRIDAGMV
ncbi:hypothetical protein T12_3333 [Trichinella patagoniensis]|uniref:Uncharacterized protein n=1 Tax=Trichinella patagoniensis TaxID=990121 RepID=A0A0V0ZX15_9BILA|nr:hypothetical protein T12_3333 [Trichinella patagoniensis]